MLNVGIIGCGRVTTMFHLNAIVELDEVKVVAVADPNRKNMEEVKQKSGASVGYLDYHELLKNSKVEAVAINTPPNLHEEMIIESLQAGKHVLCEKPVAKNVESFNHIKKVMEDTGYLVIPVHNYSLTPCLRSAHNLIENGEIGTVKQVSMSFDNNLWSYRSKTGFRVEDQYGIIDDIMPHVLSVVYTLANPGLKLIDVEAWKKRYPVIDNLKIFLKDEMGVSYDCQMNWTSIVPRFDIEILGEYGSLEMDLMKRPYKVNINANGTSRTMDKKGLSKYIEIAKFKHPAFRKQYLHFARVIEGVEVPDFTLDDELFLVSIMNDVTKKISDLNIGE